MRIVAQRCALVWDVSCCQSPRKADNKMFLSRGRGTSQDVDYDDNLRGSSSQHTQITTTSNLISGVFDIQAHHLSLAISYSSKTLRNLCLLSTLQ